MAIPARRDVAMEELPRGGSPHPPRWNGPRPFGLNAESAESAENAEKNGNGVTATAKAGATGGLSASAVLGAVGAETHAAVCAG